MILNMNIEDGPPEPDTLLLDRVNGKMDQVQIQENKEPELEYQLNETAPMLVNVFLALQHILMSLSSALSTAFIVSDVVCIGPADPLRTKLFCSTLFLCGVCSIFQTVFGVRLPVYQGPSSSFLVPLLALKQDPNWACPNVDKDLVSTSNVTTTIASGNSTETTTSIKLLPVEERLQQLSGSLMIASLIEVVIGGSGLVGPLLKYIGPITVAPTLSLIGISIIRVAIIYSRPQWAMSILAAGLVLAFSLYLYHIRIPIPRIQFRKSSKDVPQKPRIRFALFQMLPVLLSILILWVIASILTVTNVLSKDDPLTRRARTDVKLSIVNMSPWFYVPYPGQFGFPTINTAVIVGFAAATLSSLIESVGDYFAAAKACQVPAPPDHAVTRGILVEGLGSILSGAIGVGHATTSYSGNIAAICLCKTASRSVMITAGLLLIVLSVFGKIAACLTLIPDPALGGTLIIVLGLLVSLGLSNLRHVDLNSNRNLIIIGTSLVVGLMIPQWIELHPDTIATGNGEVDNILRVVLGTPMFLGGMVALILDNTVRGSLEERGMLAWRQSHATPSMDTHSQNTTQRLLDDVYDVPLVKRLYKCCPILSKLPFLPKNINHAHNADSSQILKSI